MLILLSPAKKQHIPVALPPALQGISISTRSFLSQTQMLIAQLKTFSPQGLSHLMGISHTLADLNWQRFQAFGHLTNPTAPALFAFQGEAYQSLEANTFSPQDLAFATAHLRILSGLYGLLRPLDAIELYRLEMRTPLSHPQGKDLYALWRPLLSLALHQDPESHLLINLASEEYANALNRTLLKSPVIDICFQTQRHGKRQTIGILAKRARGRMARYLIQTRASTLEDLYGFNDNGYAYQPELSSSTQKVFVRPDL